MKGGRNMKYVCAICGWIYEEDLGHSDTGILPGTVWENISGDFVCPLCGADKAAFNKEA